MRNILLLAILAASALPAEFPFRTASEAEVVAAIEMSSPGADWAKPGREAAVAEISVGGVRQHVVLFGGAERRRYRVLLGPLAAGAHTLRVNRSGEWSAPGAGLTVHGASFEEYPRSHPDWAMIANAPYLDARPGTEGKFTDVPLVAVCDRRNGILEYTVIYSNEDGGTSTRNLMARWGRATDIEWIYRTGAAGAFYQGRDHKDLPFRGAFDGLHPRLITVTDNNMVADSGASPLHFRIAPIPADLSAGTRESLMDADPVLHRVMATELEREGKLRPPGTRDGEKVADPRHYLYLDARGRMEGVALAVFARVNGEWHASHAGRPIASIARSGWFRTSIEVPSRDVTALAFGCIAGEKGADGECRVEEVRQAFFLDREYRPEPDLWRSSTLFDVPVGRMREIQLPARSASVSAREGTED
jgi:hypothetical protein